MERCGGGSEAACPLCNACRDSPRTPQAAHLTPTEVAVAGLSRKLWCSVQLQRTGDFLSLPQNLSQRGLKQLPSLCSALLSTLFLNFEQGPAISASLEGVPSLYVPYERFCQMDDGLS